MSDTAPIDTAMTVLLDGRPHAVSAGSSLASLVASLGHASDATGTAVNGDFVPRSQRSTHILQPHDVVLLFQPIVGG